MKKQKQRKTSSPKNRSAGQAEALDAGGTSAPTRRAFLARAQSWGVVAAVGAGGGWLAYSELAQAHREKDLSRIGNGIPTVVQIHDPQCQICMALQAEARAALKEFDESRLQYVVANIRTQPGRALAARHGVGHVTLLLFDGAGTRRETLEGPSTSAALEAAFRRHLQRHG
ncbi:MAG: hypothetical protein AAFV62_12860 [Pseudomonadota bacterium]